jgi:hypothetical protein
MTTDEGELERFLNTLDGDVIAIVPNVSVWFMWAHRVDFLFIIERLG